MPSTPVDTRSRSTPRTNIDYSISLVIQAVIVFCVATPALIVAIFRLKQPDDGPGRPRLDRVGEVTDVLDPPLEEALATPDHEIVTLENLRAVSQGRSRGLGVTVLVFALIELLYFGFRTDHAAETTIQFASDTATVVPALSSAMRVVVALLGAGCITVGVVLLVRHRMRALAVLALVVGAGLVAWVLALLLHFNSQGALKTLTVPVSGTAWLIGAVSLVGGAYLVVSRPSRPAYPIFFSATALFILAFLVWIARGSNVGTVPPLELTGILGLSFISATPLIYGSLSGVMCERAGVVNIAIEGQFMFGAMSGAIVASVIGGTTLGLVAGTAVAGAFGALLGCALAYMALHFRANQIIVGVVIVAFCTAMVQFMMDQVLNNKQSLNTGVGALPIAIPGLSKIPFFGPIFFDQTYFVYLAVVLVALVNFVLFRTRIGPARPRGRREAKGRRDGRAQRGAHPLRHGDPRRLRRGHRRSRVHDRRSGIPMGVGITGGRGVHRARDHDLRPLASVVARSRPRCCSASRSPSGPRCSLYLNQLVIPTELIYALPYIVTIAAVARPRRAGCGPPAADGIPYSRE